MAEAHAWIDRSLAELGLDPAGEVGQFHVRPWSTVIRVPTGGGDVYFKAAIPGLAHDVAVTSTLARLRPGLVIAPLLVDPERQWMLLPEGGQQLREVIAVERHPRRWYDLMPLYADLQIAAVPVAAELVEVGVPDYRLAQLPALAERLRSELGLPGPRRERVARQCVELAALGIPETIQHDDLHDGNVFVRESGYAFFDWGDSCISHPFASLVVGLRGIAYRFELGEHDPELDRLRGAYLRAWSSYGAPATLARAAELAAPLGMLSRALAWWRVVTGVAESDRSEYSEIDEKWFEEFAAALA